MSSRETSNKFASRKAYTASIPTPSLEPASMLRFMQAVKEFIEVRDTTRATQHDRFVTFRDLEYLGITPSSLTVVGGPRAGTGITIQLPGGGFASISTKQFEDSLRNSKLYRDLIARLDDPSRFNALPELVQAILLPRIADEAAKRGADVRSLETKIQQESFSAATAVREVTAATSAALAGVRETTFAVADAQSATAGQVTQIEARLNDSGGTGVTIEEVLYGTATNVGLYGQWTLKIDAAGKVAGIGLANETDLAGVGTSIFTVLADKFAVFTSGGDVMPFGVDASGVYINGQLRVNAGGTALQDFVKSLVLTASAEAFQVAQSGTTSPSSITFTATLKGGLTGTVVWSTSPTVTLTGTGNTRTLSAANMGTNTSVRVTASVTSGGVTYTDTFSVFRLLDGVDALTGLLTNEAHTVPATSAGVVTSWTGAGGTFRVYRGTTLLTSGVTFSVPTGGNPNGLTYSLGSSTGVFSVSGAGAWPDATATATLTLRATIGTTTIDKVFTVTKSTAGVNGTDGTDGADGTDGTRGTIVGAGAPYGIRVSAWSDAKANRVISNLLNGESLATDLATTTHLEIGDTVTLSGGQLWERTRNAYAAGIAYAPGDVVLYTDTAVAASAQRERLYRALVQTTGNAPTGTNIGTRWVALAQVPENYSGTRAYTAGEHVYYLSGGVNRLYRAITSTTGNLPTNTSFWAVIGPSSIAWAAGLNYIRGSVVLDSDSLTYYYANVAHVSGTDWLVDRDGSAFAETRFWAGVQGWQTVGVTIDGNAIVKGTLVADRLVAGNSSTGVSVAGTIPVTNAAGQSITNGVYIYQNNSSLYGLYAKNSYVGSSGGVAFFESYGGWTIDSVITGPVGTLSGGGKKAAMTARADNGGYVHLGVVKETSGGATYAAYSVGGLYGPFTGAHDALLPKADACDPGDIVVDVQIVARQGVSDTIGTCARSSTANQPGAIGVMSGRQPLSLVAAFRLPDGTEDPLAATYRVTHDLISVNSLGEGQINVCGEGGDIALGDLIVPSGTPGKGMKQSDDIVRSRTVARAREAATFASPTEVKQIACVYLCG